MENKKSFLLSGLILSACALAYSQTYTEYSANVGSAATRTTTAAENLHVTGNNAGTTANAGWTKAIDATLSQYLKLESGTFRLTGSSTSTTFDAIYAAYVDTIVGKALSSGPNLYGNLLGSSKLSGGNNPKMEIESGTFRGFVTASRGIGATDSNVGTATLNVNAGTFSNQIGGVGVSSANYNDFIGNTAINIKGGTYGATNGIFGGTLSDTTKLQGFKGNSNVTISNAAKISFAVGGNRITSSTSGSGVFTGNTNVNLNEASTSNLLIGGNYINVLTSLTSSSVVGNTNVSINNSKVLTGGGDITNGVIGGSVIGSVSGTATTTVSNNSEVNGMIIGGNFGSGDYILGASVLNINNSKMTASEEVSSPVGNFSGAIYGGNLLYSKGARNVNSTYTVNNDVKVNITGSTINSKIYAGGGVYGSETYTEKSIVKGGVYLNIIGSTVNNTVYGGIMDNGSANYEINGGTHISVKNSIITKDIVSGGQNANTAGNSIIGGTSIELSEASSVTGNLYGGGYNMKGDHKISGGTKISVNSSSVTGNFYGGSYQYSTGTATIDGGSSIVISGNKNSTKITGSIFGGGYNNNIGAVTINNGTKILVNGGLIDGTIYGGGYQTAAGNMTINGGTSLTFDLVDRLKITGEIYGGGHKVQSLATSKIYDGTSITFLGNSKNMQFYNTVYGGGKNGAAIASGTKNLYFGNSTKAYKGDFYSTTKDFDSININANSLLVWKKYGTSTNTTTIANHGDFRLGIDTSLSQGASFDINFSSNNKFKSYGGVYSSSTGKVTLVDKNTYAMDSSTHTATLNKTISKTQNSSLIINDSLGASKMKMLFHVETAIGANVHSVKNIESTTHISTLQTYAAYEILGEMATPTASESDGILYSFMINRSDLDVYGFDVWHKNGNDWIKKTDLVEGLGYDGANLSFIDDEFGSWAVTSCQVPETGTCALLLGVFSLAYIIRKRKK